MDRINHLKKLCQLIRYDILTMTTNAGSGHPTSSLSAVELMVTLFFGGFMNECDRIIFSKGHAAPLLYSLYHAAGVIDYQELLTLRKFGSKLEGHPTPRFPYVDVATGSLGQGLSVGVGMALGMRLIKLMGDARGSTPCDGNSRRDPLIWVLLGDSEMAEGQIWEAMETASYYKLSNLIAILDVNRLGQRGETMLGRDLETYAKRAESFGWNPVIIDNGHDIEKIATEYKKVEDTCFEPIAWGPDQRGEAGEKHGIETFDKPTIFIARTIKGKGISFLEDKEDWHGKVLNKEQLKQALKELGEVDLNVRGRIGYPRFTNNDLRFKNKKQSNDINIHKSSIINHNSYSTREAYGDALVNIGEINSDVVVLDAEMANSNYENKFQAKFPDRFFELFIAEENMMSVALGISKIGYIPFCSTFAAFLTQTFDQVRMSQYSNPNLKICGSHCGVSIGADGPSQMGLEDIAMFRSILNSVVFYPCDAVSTFKLTQIMAENNGLFYLRTTRGKTPVIYPENEEFKIGGSKILKNPENSQALVISAGVSVHEALKAHDQLKKEGINITVLDLYCIKPIDQLTIQQLTINNQPVIVVEDHYPSGGLGEAVLSALSTINNQQLTINFIHLCVKKLPRSGTPQELLAYEEIDANAIVSAVKSTI